MESANPLAKVFVANVHDPALPVAMEANMARFWSDFGHSVGGEVQLDWGCVRVYSGVPVPLFNGIFQAWVEPDRVERLVQAITGELQARKVPAFWWLLPTERTHKLAQALPKWGLEHVRNLTTMALDLPTLNEQDRAPEGFEVTRVVSPEHFALWNHVANQGTGVPAEIAQQVKERVGAQPNQGLDRSVRRYIGWYQGKAVATSAMVLNDGVAGIYAVATLPAYRRMGMGYAVTQAALVDARQQGYGVAVSQPTEAGYSVYRRLGFVDSCQIAMFLWQP